MDNPLSSPDSQLKSLNEPATDKTPLGLNKTVKFNEPQIIMEPAEESRPENLNKQTEDRVPQDLSEPDKFSQPQSTVKSPEENTPQVLNEQSKDSETQGQDHRLQDLNEPYEDSKRPDLNQLASDSTAQDVRNEPEEQQDAPHKMSLEKEESPLPSASKGQEIPTTDDIPAPNPILDDNVQGLPDPATDSEPQALKVLVETVVVEPEQPLQDRKETPSPVFPTGVQEKTPKTEKAEAPHSFGNKRPMFSWTPPQLAKATLRPTPKPQTADKATQILPGRVPMLTKLPLKRVLPPKPKPPSADKATEISPSFERLLKRPPPLVKKKKKKKEETSTMSMTRVCPPATSLPNMRQPFSSHYGRWPRATANSHPPHVRSSKSRPLRVKSLPSRPQHVKSAKSMPLRVQLSSSSPSKHRLNLSLCPKKKRKIICNLNITFCDNCEEPKPCCVPQTHWEESLSSCSGLYRACSVFSIIKYGKIHMSNLLLALHTLGILVTSDEMHHFLHFINVDEHGSLNFCEFLEAVNTTSPFAEIPAFQNTLQAFRKMKKGTVTVKELEPIFHYLGITLSPETVQQTLGHTKVNKNGKFDFSDFLLTAKDFQRILEEEEEAFLNERSIFQRRPFQDVSDLVDAECRRRRKYGDCFDEETPMPTCRLSFLRQQESAEDATLGKQQSRASKADLKRSSTASSIIITKEEAKDSDAMEMTTSQMGLSSDVKSSSSASLLNNAKGGNKDDDATDLEKSPSELPSQNAEEPVPS